MGVTHFADKTNTEELWKITAAAALKLILTPIMITLKILTAMPFIGRRESGMIIRAGRVMPAAVKEPRRGKFLMHDLTLTKENGAFKLASDPSAGKVAWIIRLSAEN